MSKKPSREQRNKLFLRVMCAVMAVAIVVTFIIAYLIR